MDSGSSIDELVGYLDSGDEVRSHLALEVLSRLGPKAKDATLALIAIALDERKAWGDRAMALGVLAKIGPEAKAAVPGLVTLLDKERVVSTWAVSALAGIGRSAEPALPNLLPLLCDASKKPVDRQAAAMAIGKVLSNTSKEARCEVGLLRDILKNEKEEVSVRQGAAYALGEIGPAALEAVPDLERGLQAQGVLRLSCLLALLKIADDDRVSLLVSLLSDQLRSPHKQVSRAAAEALLDLDSASLGAIPGLLDVMTRDAVPVLVAMMGSDDEGSSVIAATILGRIGAPAKNAIPALIWLLRRGARESIGAAARALGEIGPEAKEALPVLQQILEEDRFGKAGDVLYQVANAIERTSARPVSSVPTSCLPDGNDGE